MVKVHPRCHSLLCRIQPRFPWNPAAQCHRQRSGPEGCLRLQPSHYTQCLQPLSRSLSRPGAPVMVQLMQTQPPMSWSAQRQQPEGVGMWGSACTWIMLGSSWMIRGLPLCFLVAVGRAKCLMNQGLGHLALTPHSLDPRPKSETRNGPTAHPFREVVGDEVLQSIVEPALSGLAEHGCGRQRVGCVFLNRASSFVEDLQSMGSSRRG